MALDSPIVVLDSGLGGLTVVRALRRALPHEQIVYFGDTARLPYGAKSAATICGFVKQIIRRLQSLEPKHVLIACNSATAMALPAARAEFPRLSISGVIEPGARAAILAAGARPKPIIGVLATEATVRSKAYQSAILRRRNLARVLLRAAPLLVPMIEEGRGERDPLVDLALKEYLAPFKEYQPDVLLLGCTHYPALRSRVERIMGPGTKVIDSAEQCAEDVARRLGETGLARWGPVKSSAAAGAECDSSGGLRCIVTDDPERFERLAPRFLGARVGRPQLVPPELLYGPAEDPLAGVYPSHELRAAG